MNTNEIQFRLDALINTMLDKDMRTPNARLFLTANESPIVALTCGSYGGRGYWCAHPGAETAEEALTMAEKLISDFPDAAESNLRAHHKRVADVIHAARDTSIPDEYVTPLMAVHEALSTNLLGVAK